jgi:hypothetical protein
MDLILLTGARQVWLSSPLPPQMTPGRTETRQELRLPDQSKPVNRLRVIQPFTVAYQVGTSDGKPMITYVEQAAPFPDTQDHFSNRVDQPLGICPLLSANAVAQCFQAGGLFR